MRGLPRILLLFRDELNKFNSTGARLLEFFYRMTLNTTLESRLKFAWNKAVMLPYIYTQNKYGRHYTVLQKL